MGYPPTHPNLHISQGSIPALLLSQRFLAHTHARVHTHIMISLLDYFLKTTQILILLLITIKHCGCKSHLIVGPLIYYGSFGEVSLTALIFINAQIIPKEGNLIFKPDFAQENQTHLHKHTLNIQTCVQTHTSSQSHPNRLFTDLLSHLPRPKKPKNFPDSSSFLAHNLHEGKSYWLYFKNISRKSSYLKN